MKSKKKKRIVFMKGTQKRFRLAVLLLLLFPAICFSESQNSQDGSLNTNTVDSTVSSNNNTEDRSVSKTYNGMGSSSQMPVNSAITPTYMSTGLETCLQGQGAGLQTGIVGISKGNYRVDKNCNRRRDAKVLSDLGMKVAAIARMCEDSAVWKSMFVSGTPCPILSGSKLVVGKRAFLLMKREPELYIPDYGKVRMRLPPVFSKKPPFPAYTKKQQWYNRILKIGEIINDEEGDDIVSVSGKFRSSLQ